MYIYLMQLQWYRTPRILDKKNVFETITTIVLLRLP